MNKTIFSTITSPYQSSICIIRISGKKTKECLNKLGIKDNLLPNRSSLHKIVFNNKMIDEAIITFYKAPKSYTGEDVAEISVHNSPYIIKKIYQELLKIDEIDIASNGEFTKRAFLNEKIDLIQAEAILDLINSETEAQHNQSIKQLSGELGKIYFKWKDLIIEILSYLEALIDFPEDDIDKNTKTLITEKISILKNEIFDHLNDNELGLKIKNGLSLVIFGAPNSGKSTLINFLTKSDISIVSEIAGTTRDVINHRLEISGLPIIISDTAGIRETSDPIEKEGVKRALNKISEADLKILVIDASNPEINNELADEKTIIIFNKIDKIENFNPNNVLKNINLKSSNYILTSLINNINTNSILNMIKNKIDCNFKLNNNSLITQERYRFILQNCLKNLEEFNIENSIEINAEYLRICANEISKISGKIDIDNILDSIFSKFCIGK